MGTTETRLRELRLEKNIRQEELAEMVGVSRQTVSKWETGAVMPSAGNLRRLSELYGVSVDVLLGGAIPVRPAPPPESSAQEPEVPEVETPPAPKRKKRRWVCVLTAALLAAAVTVGGFLLWRTFNGLVPMKELKSEEVIEPPAGTLPLLPPE